MKLTHTLWFSFFVLILVCTGCTKDAVETSQVETQVVNFSFFQVDMSPIETQSTRTRGDGTEKSLGATDFTILDIALIPVNKSVKDTIYSFRQSKADDASTFGKVSMKVPVGEYKLVAIASKDGNVQIHSQTEAEFVGKVTDMAYICQDVVVKKDNNTFNCSLKRAVAKFKLSNTGTRDLSIKKFTIRATGNCSNKFNPSTGLATGTDGIAVSFTITKDTQMQVGGAAIFYAFLVNQEEKNITVSVDINDADDNLLKSLEFSQVGMKVNYCTTYKGDVFGMTSTAGFTFYDEGFADYGETTFEE